jgi:hypothetical protein
VSVPVMNSPRFAIFFGLNTGPRGVPVLNARGMKRTVFVVPALAGIRRKNRLKAGLRTAHFRPRAV